MDLGDDGTATSFRQVGKETRGHLRRGFTAGQHSGARTFSSIPSKFETTLFTGAKPKEGFGSRAHRFTETENDLPGPGSYEGASVPLRDDKVYSKKGLGVGFVSKTQRQGLVRPGVVPGPGNYEETRTLARDLAARGASSAFKQPSQRPVTVTAAGSQPGPGQYSTATPGSFDARQAEWRRERSKRESDAARSASLQMRMQSGLMPTPPKRSVPPAASTLPTPGPTEYQPKLASDMPNAEHTLPSGWARASGRTGGKKPLRTSLEQQLGIVPRDDGGTPVIHASGAHSLRLHLINSPVVPLHPLFCFSFGFSWHTLALHKLSTERNRPNHLPHRCRGRGSMSAPTYHGVHSHYTS